MVDRFGIQWINKQKTWLILFTRNSLKKPVKYLLENCYFKIFRQIIDIPINSYTTPFLQFFSCFNIKVNGLWRWKRMMLDEQEDLLMYSSSLILVHCTLLSLINDGKFEPIFKNYLIAKMFTKGCSEVWSTNFAFCQIWIIFRTAIKCSFSILKVLLVMLED